MNRPALTPPDWVFAPVWTVLYLTIAASIMLYYRSTPRPHTGLTSTVLAAHLAANFAWTGLFFGLHSPVAALADILLLDASLVLLITWFWQANKVASLLLIPYCLWVLFATYLNYGFYRLNP